MLWWQQQLQWSFPCPSAGSSHRSGGRASRAGSVAAARAELAGSDGLVALDAAAVPGEDAGVEEFLPASVLGTQEGAA